MNSEVIQIIRPLSDTRNKKFPIQASTKRLIANKWAKIKKN